MKTFIITPASSGPIIFFIVLTPVLLTMLGFSAYILFSAHSAKFEITDSGLNIRNTIYGRFIPKENIDLNNARIVNLNTQTDLQPKWRTNGVGLPGYNAGWFKLKNGEKTLLFVTDRGKVVYIPTTLGYPILLSTGNPDEMVVALQTLCPN